jgi:hypothetical protein
MNGILLLGRDEVIESRAKRFKVSLQHGDTPELIFVKTLITVPGTRVPWDLLPAAWILLENWDAAVPLWRYDTTAEGAGTVGEREETRLIIRDLRVLLHCYELLFVRKNEAGQALVETWVREYSSGGDKRLAFLRALYHVKPRLCVLPTSWLAEVQVRGPVQRGVVQPARTLGVKPANAGRKLVTVELQPGRLVKCHKGDEERVLEQFRRQQKEARHGNRK